MRSHRLKLSFPSSLKRIRSFRPRRRQMPIYILPNLITTANLFCGFFSILQSFKGEFTYAAYAIIAAAVFDFMDGRVARWTSMTSTFGMEYDSLCDLLSFGLAPAMLMYKWTLEPFGRLGWMIAFVYVACGALRLARHNAHKSMEEQRSNNPNPNMDFSGLPIPIAAGILTGFLLSYYDFFEVFFAPMWKEYISLAIVLLISFCMVSSFRYRSFKQLTTRHSVSFKYMILALGVFALVVYWPEVLLFVLFLSYALWGLLENLFTKKSLIPFPKKFKGKRKRIPQFDLPSQENESPSFASPKPKDSDALDI